MPEGELNPTGDCKSSPNAVLTKRNLPNCAFYPKGFHFNNATQNAARYCALRAKA
jgi:hypothetical protein